MMVDKGFYWSMSKALNIVDYRWHIWEEGFEGNLKRRTFHAMPMAKYMTMSMSSNKSLGHLHYAHENSDVWNWSYFIKYAK
jgi:hypothetical protein